MKKIDLKLSKVLASHVLDIPLEAICDIYMDGMSILIRKMNNRIEEHSIYEFAFKCKEWALKKEFIVHSSPTQKKEFTSIAQNFNMNQLYYGKNQFYALTEMEAILKACEWILENSK